MIEFRLPSLGADMDEGTLLEWHIKPGDPVKKGQVVAIVDTTKAAVDVECWQEGTVGELRVQPGEKIPVDTVMAIFLEPGDKLGDLPRKEPDHKVGASDMAAAAPAPAAVPNATQTAPYTAPTRHPVSPAARKRAAELGVDVEVVTGTGPHRSVTVADVDQAAPKIAVPVDKSAEMRKAIAATMARSKREIPHYYLSETIPMTRALAWLVAENTKRTMSERLLPAVLLLKAVALALKKYPELNGIYAEGEYQPSQEVHLGVAISLRQGGLIAPALLDAGHQSLTRLMQSLTDLVKRARAGSLKSSEMNKPTVTVTNLGDQGSETVYGVIYPPQVALVGFGRISERPWVVEGQVQGTQLITASLAADHRISDGHRGALFLVELRELLQQPEELSS